MLGALILDKPEGMTSHDVVARVRRLAGLRRVGHIGTLDPFATGVLVVCVGRATRLARFLVGLDKQYEATVRLGFATDTQDATGKQMTPLKTSNESNLEGIRRVLDGFIGPQFQTPPMFSAKKVGGERLYRAAREGREVPREPVSITIHSIELIEAGPAPVQTNADGTIDFAIRVRCSSGTYVRTLANDIGERLGLGGHLAALRRTAVGQFRIEQSVSLEALERAENEMFERILISPRDMLSHLPAIELDHESVVLVKNGRAVNVPEGAPKFESSHFRLCDEKGEMIAVGEHDEASGRALPRVVLDGKG